MLKDDRIKRERENMKPYILLNDDITFAFSAENQTGTRGGGGRGGDCTKLSPKIRIQPGETAVLVDTEGPGIIQKKLLPGYLGHNSIIRIYWE